MKLDLTKKVQTRDGRPVEIKFTDGRGDYQITGYIDDAKLTDCWTINGKYDERDGKESQWDLINAPEWHLPDPPEGYEWHRTDWTEEMLPDGWRPLLLGEGRASDFECKYYDPNARWGPWIDGHECDESQYFFRTKRPLPPPKPKLREVPLCADDVKAGDEFLVGSYRHIWLSIKAGCVTYGNGALYSFEEMMRNGHKTRSIGETEWRKCSKMEEVPA